MKWEDKDINSYLMEIYSLLLNEFGKQNWWPADSKFEVCVGAILTQMTSWKNVEKAINNLKNENLLKLEKITQLNQKRLEDLIKPSGFYKQKARRLKRFSNYIYKNYGCLETFFKSKETSQLREELLQIKGIGEETVDSILLYGGDKLTFVIDAYTKRIFKGLEIEIGKNYEEIKAWFEKELPRNLEIYKEFHALIVELGKRYCKTEPECEKCPINYLCEESKV